MTSEVCERLREMHEFILLDSHQLGINVKVEILETPETPENNATEQIREATLHYLMLSLEGWAQVL